MGDGNESTARGSRCYELYMKPGGIDIDGLGMGSRGRIISRLMDGWSRKRERIGRRRRRRVEEGERERERENP
jgi:hypothetical protein